MRRVRYIAIVLLNLCGSIVWAQTNLTASLAQIPDRADSPESGVFTELVKAIDEIYQEGSIAIQVVPFARSVQNVLRGNADFHVPNFVNSEIPEDQLPFSRVPEPLGTVTLVIYSNVENPITNAEIDAARASGGEFPYVIEVGAGSRSLLQDTRAAAPSCSPAIATRR